MHVQHRRVSVAPSSAMGKYVDALGLDRQGHWCHLMCAFETIDATFCAHLRLLMLLLRVLTYDIVTPDITPGAQLPLCAHKDLPTAIQQGF